MSSKASYLSEIDCNDSWAYSDLPENMKLAIFCLNASTVVYLSFCKLRWEGETQRKQSLAFNADIEGLYKIKKRTELGLNFAFE